MSDFAIKGQLKLDGTEFTGTLRLSSDELKKFGDTGKRASEGLKAAGDAADRAGGQTAKLRKEVADTDNMTRKLVSTFGQLFAAYKLIDITKQVDSYQSLKDRLRGVTENTTQFTVAYRELLKTANATGTSMETNIQLFQRMRLAGKDISATTAEMLVFNKAVQQLGVISGASTEALQAGTLQLGQALSGSVVHAEEFNSVMENIPAVGVKIAEAMGKTPGQLRQAIINGEILSRDVFNALLKQAGSIGTEFEKMPVRLGRATQDLKNSLLDALSQLDESVGMTRGVAGAMEDLAKDMRSVGTAIVGLTAASALPALLSLLPKVRNAWIALNVVVAANPFVILASAIAGVTAAIYTWRKSMTDQERLGELLQMPESSQRGYLRKEIEALQKSVAAANADKGFQELKEKLEEVREKVSMPLQTRDYSMDLKVTEIAKRHEEIIAFNKKFNDSITEQTKAIFEAQKAAVSYTADQEDEITVLGLLARGNKEEAEATQKKLELMRSLGPKVYKQFESLIDDLIQKQMEAKRSTDYWAESQRDLMEMLNRSQEDAAVKTTEFFEKRKADAERNATDWSGIWRHSMENMVDILADGFARGRVTLQDFFNSVRQIASQIAGALVFRPVVGSVLGGLAGMGVPGAADAATGMGFSGAGAAGAGAAGYAAAGGWMSSLGSSLGFGSVADFSAVGGSSQVAVSGSLTSASLGATLGAGALGALGGYLLAPALGLNRTNSTIGAGSGAAIGMMVGGPWGAAAGALIGLLAGLFGPGESNKTEGYQFNPLSGSNIQVGNMPGSAKFSQQNLQSANTFMTGITGLVQGISNSTGAKYTGGKIGIDTGNRDGTNVYFYDKGGSANFSTMQEAVAYTISRVTTMFEGLPKDVETAFQNIDWTGDLQENLTLVQFAASFQDNIKAMMDGTLSIQESAYVGAKQVVESYVAQIHDFKENTAKLGLDTDAADKATRSFVERIVGLKDTIDQGSPLHQALEAIRGTFAAIGPLLTEVGMDASQAGTLMAAAVAKLRTTFTGNLQAQLEDAMGNGFLTTIRQAIAARTQNRNDARDLDADNPTNLASDLTLVDRVFTETVRNIIRGGNLSTAQLQLIATTFSDIPEVVALANAALSGLSGTLTAAADAWSAMNDAEGRGFLNQIQSAILARGQGRTAAGGDQQTLTWVDRAFAATLHNIISSGTLTVEQLQVIAATFSGIPEVVSEANAALHGANATFTAANDNLRKQLVDLAQAQMDAVNVQIQAQQDLVNSATRIAQDMRQAAFALSIDPRRGSAKSQIDNILMPTYERLLSQAQGGDVNAAGQLKSVGDALVNAAEKAYGTTGPFQAIASRVEQGYLQVAGAADTQLGVATAQLNVLNAQLAELRRISAGGGTTAAAGGRVTTDADFAALNSGFASAVANSGLSMADFAKTSTFQVYQQALLQDISGYSGVSKLQSDLAFHEGQSSDAVLGSSSQQVVGAIKDRLHDLGVPGYAKGGWSWGGLRLAGEEGPELQLGGPARFYNASDTRSMLAGAMNDNSGLGPKIDQLVAHAAAGNAISQQILSVTRAQAATIASQAKTIARQDQELRELRLQQRRSG